MAGFVVAVVLGSAAIALAAFVSYLVFCAFVVKRMGGTSGLRDVAEAVRVRGRGKPEPAVSPKIHDSAVSGAVSEDSR
jgi:hypothetical protein